MFDQCVTAGTHSHTFVDLFYFDNENTHLFGERLCFLSISSLL